MQKNLSMNLEILILKILIDNDGTLSVEFGAYGVPETFLIDKNKKIIEKFVGPINEEIIKKIKLIIR